MDLSHLLVVVIDDNRTTRHIVSGILQKFKVGHIFEAENGADALEQITAVAPDIIFCDWLMQPVNGIEFVRRVRAGATTISRDTPIIMMTSQVEASQVLEAKEAGVSGYLAKPLTAGRVVAQLVAHLSGDARRRAMQSAQRKRPIQLVG